MWRREVLKKSLPRGIPCVSTILVPQDELLGCGAAELSWRSLDGPIPEILLLPCCLSTEVASSGARTAPGDGLDSGHGPLRQGQLEGGCSVEILVRGEDFVCRRRSV